MRERYHIVVHFQHKNCRTGHYCKVTGYWCLTSLNISEMIRDNNKYVGPCYWRAEMHADCVACWPLVSHGEYADGTDRQTEARPCYIALSAKRGQRNNVAE